MFLKSAQWYDLLYSFKDYQKEALYIVELLNQFHPDARTLLDVACGTAEHDHCLFHRYKIDGIDINEEFVRIAQEKNPTGSYSCADMQDFDLGRKYDAIRCLFSSIGYVKTLAKEEMLMAFKIAGLMAEFYENDLFDRGLFIARAN